MKNKKGLLALLIITVFVSLANPAHAQQEKDADKTLSPYFFVKSDDPEVDQLPLKSTAVKVYISGVIADVAVKQVYKNEGKKPLEAIYIFPASTRAAVYGMKMTIGKRTVVAKIRKREAARREYEQAKQEGKSASLLEQHRPNVFQMNVANILPSDVIEVELKYTELLVPTDAVYGFVYPTVVGPRYSDRRITESHPSEKWIENPYLHQGESPAYTFNITVELAAGLPIRDVTCSSHKVTINYRGPALASVKLDPSERYGGNRDFLLKYRLAGGKIETGLLLFEGEEENFFLLMLQPPKRVSDHQIPPREYIFIVDVSGSMHGFPLDISKKLLRDLIGNLRPTDRFNVLLFAGGSSIMSKRSLPASRNNVRRAINMIERRRGGGGTRLLPALKRALSLERTEGYSRSVVIVTDGYVSVEEEAFDLIRHNLGNANMFAFGIGSSVNRFIIEGMARVGMGEPFIITRPGEAPDKARTFRKLIQSPVLTGIKIDSGEFDVYDVEPPSIPDVLADRPVIVFGKWRGKPKGTIRVRGISGDGTFMEKIDVAEVKPLKTNSALRYLWARHRIAILSDYNRLSPQDERVREVTDLGITYNLLTAYTSFVAIDTRIRLKDGKAVTVKQPLPLPQGVSDYAVGKGSFARKALPSVTPRTLTMRKESRATEQSHEYEKKHLAADSTAATPALKEINIELGKIAVTEGLSKESVQKLLNKHLSTINRCYKRATGNRSGIKGEFTFTLLIDSEGRVIKVIMDTSSKKNKELEKCIDQQLKTLIFPSRKESQNAVVTVAFILK
ncbi:MAG: AgmX/PglI C-terminal domain-containing protein [Deltaproteobacteria bacterium]|nr:AgmX/PglI C-terminal domain-containing protein [Deltaproteobacteria bacterium]